LCDPEKNGGQDCEEKDRGGPNYKAAPTPTREIDFDASQTIPQTVAGAWKKYPVS
jgi:hypothetical protein